MVLHWKCFERRERLVCYGLERIKRNFFIPEMKYFGKGFFWISMTRILPYDGFIRHYKITFGYTMLGSVYMNFLVTILFTSEVFWYGLNVYHIFWPPRGAILNFAFTWIFWTALAKVSVILFGVLEYQTISRINGIWNFRL